MAMSMRVSNMGGRVIATKRSGVRSYHQHDALGNTIALINDSGVVTDTYAYWPYGELRTSTGSTTNPFKFCGAWGYYTDTTGRTYVRARTLRPGLTRWMTVDPLWPEEPAYPYADTSPLNQADPTGLKCGIWLSVGVPSTTNCKKIMDNILSTGGSNAWGFTFCVYSSGKMAQCVCDEPKDCVTSVVKIHENSHMADFEKCCAKVPMCMRKNPSKKQLCIDKYVAWQLANRDISECRAILAAEAAMEKLYKDIAKYEPTCQNTIFSYVVDHRNRIRDMNCRALKAANKLVISKCPDIDRVLSGGGGVGG